jgi:mannosyl-glycoprotein endo-beta-N-acetylglucosaminidase
MQPIGFRQLGTFITEFDAGKAICRELLASDETVDRAVEALVLLMDWHHFEGYLLNIENPIEVNLSSSSTILLLSNSSFV